MKKIIKKANHYKVISFNLSMFLIVWGILCTILSKFICKNHVDITIALTLSIGTLICAPLSYYLVNKNFKSIPFSKYYFWVIQVYFILMLIIGLLLSLCGILSF